MSELIDATGKPIPDSQRTRCETWSRVMGYLRPKSEWNAGKRSEDAERKHFKEVA